MISWRWSFVALVMSVVPRVLVRSFSTSVNHCVRFQGVEFVVEDGETLRSALLRKGLTPHNGRSKLINCRGLGTCGTCAVSLPQGSNVQPVLPNAIEWARLSLPPHNNVPLSDPTRIRRLACQVCVHGAVDVKKMAGFWGSSPDTPSSDTKEDFKVYFGEMEHVFDQNIFKDREKQ